MILAIGTTGWRGDDAARDRSGSITAALSGLGHVRLRGAWVVVVELVVLVLVVLEVEPGTVVVDETSVVVVESCEDEEAVAGAPRATTPPSIAATAPSTAPRSLQDPR